MRKAVRDKDMSVVQEQGWLPGAIVLPSSHYDDRAPRFQCASSIDLLVIHNISLPPAQCEGDFDNDNVEAFFTGQLDPNGHEYFTQIADMRVSAHLYIKRGGEVIQFVPLHKRAWHAGVSEFEGRSKCNDFSIGIEMQGTDDMAFTDEQYRSLVTVTKQLQRRFPNIVLDNIVGHEHIAPGRKTDPGRCFDWSRYKDQLQSEQ